MEPPPDCSSCYMKADDCTSYKRKAGEKKESLKDKDCGEYLDLTVKKDAFQPQKNFKKHQTPVQSLSKDVASSVRSKAVIAYSASENNTLFSCLAPKTDLNLAPSNWLRKTVGLRPESVLPGGRYTANPSRPFSGFSMASSHLDCVGKVDVVSDAENIKKLLKMPYSKAHVSMAIHRIGRTLLLENFDIRRYSAEESEWQWFRNFYQDLGRKQEAMSKEQGSEKLFKKKSPSSQYDKLMLSKFLYYSIYKDSFNKLGDKSENPRFQASGSENVAIQSDEEDETESNIKLVELVEEKFKELSTEEEEKILELSSSSSSISEEDRTKQVVMPERRWRYWTPHESFPSQAPSEEFERNIRWTFEDLQMMLGTNMPIFGGGRYPAVSLRLRDSNKPINILTGIDYWLDNLICNVPELVMCFHVNGIVQNYEVIKTEDIPKLEHSSFSPQVVKDIAQNILSFLKSNCTKEGHTYWLFKGSGDDVVKLYDLTTLCTTTTSDESNASKSTQQNPYIFSVAMLLYKTAISLMQSKDTCDHHVTVKKLLGHCIDLLDRTKYQYIVTSAICMLSTLSLPDPGLDKPTKENTQQAKENEIPSSSVDWKKCDTCTAHHDADAATSRKNSEGPRNAEIASIPKVTDLSIPEKYLPSSSSFDLMRSPPSKPRSRHKNDETGQVEESCHTALSYVVSGLEVLIQNSKESWKPSLLRQLTRNSALAYFRLAGQASNLGKLGRALRRSRLALQSYETFDFLAPSGSENCEDDPSQSRMIPPDFHLLLPKLLSLCGELQFGIVQDIRSHGAVSLSHREELNSFTEDDKKIQNALNEVLQSEGKYGKLTLISSELDQALGLCASSYATALEAMDLVSPNQRDVEVQPKSGAREGNPKTKRTSKKNAENTQPSVTSSGNARDHEIVHELKTTLIRRHGHVINELGASTLNQVVRFLNEEVTTGAPSKKIWDKWNAANSYFEKAHKEFVQVEDVINQALVLSNMGRLRRVCAQFYSNNEDEQLSKQERDCYATAIERYQKALSLLPKHSRRGCPSTCTSVYDNISWELSSCYFSMAQILQDNAPQDPRAKEEAEKEVISLMNDSLKFCKDIWENTPKQSLVMYRQAKIHHRMASLHHNSYRNCANDAHKCKQLRILAEKQYSKSLALLEGLENPSELIRVQLERLALKEHHISSVNNANAKIQHLIECLEMICECRKPLLLIENSSKISVRTQSQVDAKETSLNSDLDTKEISGLLRILATILKSFLLGIVKLASSLVSPENNEVKKSKGKVSPEILKKLYSRTLRSFQQMKTNASVDRTVSLLDLREDIASVLLVLDDLSETMVV